MNEVENKIEILHEKKSSRTVPFTEDKLVRKTSDTSLEEKLYQVYDEIKLIVKNSDESYKETSKIYNKILQIDEKIKELYDRTNQDEDQDVVAEDVERKKNVNNSKEFLYKLMGISEKFEQHYDETPLKSVEKKGDEKLSKIDRKLNESYNKLLEAEDKIKTETDEIVLKDNKVTRDFNLKIYKELIHSLKNNNYSFSTFASFDQQNHYKNIILRHDVDRTPQNALQMAKLEKELDVAGTYYFRIIPESFTLLQPNT